MCPKHINRYIRKKIHLYNAAAKSLQSCPTFPGILQARTLAWVDISFSNE